MKKFIDSVKALGEKMTGKEIEGTKLIDVIDETAENYQGGAGSGSEIVDALPAQGKEGNTYLLRKTEINENEIFKAQAYAMIYAKAGSHTYSVAVVDADLQLFEQNMDAKLNLDSNNGLVKFSLGMLYTMTSEELNSMMGQNKVVIVKTEEDVSKITEEVDVIIQDLGEIGIEDITCLEKKTTNASSGEVHIAELVLFVNNSGFRVVKQGDSVIVEGRQIEYNSEVSEGQPKYSFTEWDYLESAPCVETLTDTYVYDQETLNDLEEGSCYLINLTPIVPEVSYSYTQYVFDQGVYSPIGEGTSSAGGQGDQYTVNALWVNTILQNSVKPKNYGFNLRQFILDYITEDINNAYKNVFCLISAQNLPDYNGENYSSSYGIYVGLGTYNDESYIFVFPSDSYAIAYDFLSDITTLDYAIAYYRVVTQKDNFYDTLLANVTDEPITGMYEDLVDKISSMIGTGNCVAKNIKFESAATGSNYSYSFFKSWSLNDVLSYFLQLPRVK